MVGLVRVRRWEKNNRSNVYWTFIKVYVGSIQYGGTETFVEECGGSIQLRGIETFLDGVLGYFD